MVRIGGYPSDLNNNEHGSPVKVMTLNGKFKRVEKATYWPDVSKKYHTRGMTARKAR